MVRATSSKRDS